jgi:RNA-binding protein Musashi
VAIIKNKVTGLSKCYAFVHSTDPRTYQRIIESKHRLNGRIIDCKDGFNKEENPALLTQLNKRKLFVGGLSVSTDDEQLTNYFSGFGEVFKGYVIIDPKTKRSKRFGFVIMKDEASVDKVLAQSSHVVNGTTINCKRFDRSSLEPANKQEETQRAPEPAPQLAQESQPPQTQQAEFAWKVLQGLKTLNGKKRKRLYLNYALALPKTLGGQAAASSVYLPLNYSVADKKHGPDSPKDAAPATRFNICVNPQVYHRVEGWLRRIETREAGAPDPQGT